MDSFLAAATRRAEDARSSGGAAHDGGDAKKLLLLQQHVRKRAATAAATEGHQFRTPFVRTPMRAVRDAFDMAGLGEADVLVDMGSGCGRTLMLACRLYNCRAIGIEFDAQLVAASTSLLAKEGLSERATIVQADFFSAEARAHSEKASVVFMFQLPGMAGNRLLPLLQELLPPSARIVSYNFAPDGQGGATAVRQVRGGSERLGPLPRALTSLCLRAD